MRNQKGSGISLISCNCLAVVDDWFVGGFVIQGFFYGILLEVDMSLSSFLCLLMIGTYIYMYKHPYEFCSAEVFTQ